MNQIKTLLKDWNTIPNWLSYIRIALIPVFAVLFYNDKEIIALIVLVVSGSTDFFDGKLARKLNQVSDLGKLLDPVADKLTQITLSIVFYLEFRNSTVELINTFSWVFLIFVIKELVMVVFGGLMVLVGLRPVAAEIVGKTATMVFYLVMIFIVMFAPDVGVLAEDVWTIPEKPLLALVVISAFITVLAFFSYLPSTFRQVADKIKESKSK